MNIFYLDDDLDKNAEYHIDKHVVKMPTEVAQLMTTAVWVDKYLGHIPRMLTKDELGIINKVKAEQPTIEERTFTRFLPTHINHPCAIWVRASRDNYEWTHCYIDALNSEWQYRYGHTKNHKSFDTVLALPELSSLPYEGLTVRPLCMPDTYKSASAVDSYRTYYINDKASIASWKNRPQPDWWPQEN